MANQKALNKCLEMYLICFTCDAPRDWVKLLPWVEYWYNTAFHTSIGIMPFKAVCGRYPPYLTMDIPDAKDPTVQELLVERDQILLKLKANLHKAQEHMKKYVDKKRSNLEFKVGDIVSVKLQPLRQNSVALRKNQKLGLRYFGPFPVIDHIGQVAYKLLLTTTITIDLVFHVSQLKQCKADHNQPHTPLPITLSDSSGTKASSATSSSVGRNGWITSNVRR